MVEVGILPRAHPNALLTLVRVEILLSAEPLILELLVESVNLRPQSLGIDVATLYQLDKLVLGDSYIALMMGPEQKDLLQVLRDDVTALDEEELALAEHAFWDDLLFEIAGTQVVKIVFEEEDVLFEVVEFTVGLASKVFGKLRSPDPVPDLDRPALEFYLADVACDETVHHELGFGDFFGFVGDFLVGYFCL